MNNFNNNFKNNKTFQLYPDEAYPEQDQKNAEQSQGGQNPLLPLLLAAMKNGDNQDNSALLSMLGGMSGNNQSQLIQTLTSSLNNKKKKEEVSPLSSDEKPFPRDEFLY